MILFTQNLQKLILEISYIRGALLSLVTAFLNLVPLLMSLSRSPRDRVGGGFCDEGFEGGREVGGGGGLVVVCEGVRDVPVFLVMCGA